jgi:hypothetical protein
MVDNFARDVSASVHGITNSGKYDSTVFREAQYKEFDTVKKSTVSVVGGDLALQSAFGTTLKTTTCFRLGRLPLSISPN